MKVGPYAGRKVSEVKPIIREELIAAGQALPYSEPEKQVGWLVGWVLCMCGERLRAGACI
jgi:hypothetical protein